EEIQEDGQREDRAHAGLEGPPPDQPHPQAEAQGHGHGGRRRRRPAAPEAHAAVSVTLLPPQSVQQSVMRIKRGVTKRKRHKKLRKRAGGVSAAGGARGRPARLAVEKSPVYAYRARRQRKRQSHRLWITRINAAVREHGLSYSRFIAGLKRAGVE